MAPVTDGLVVVDKPAGCTSHDVVARLRALYGQRRVGHAGTLDPDATGVLLVGLGRATRLMRFLQETTKTYAATVVFGIATDTLDAAGAVLDRRRCASRASQVEVAAKGFVGDSEQVPPMVSAIKIDGRRLHELARRGIEVDRPPRRVRIDRFDGGVVHRRSVPGSGCGGRLQQRDLRPLARRRPRRRAGGCAHLRDLRRRRVGPFDLADAVRSSSSRPSRPPRCSHPPTHARAPARRRRRRGSPRGGPRRRVRRPPRCPKRRSTDRSRSSTSDGALARGLRAQGRGTEARGRDGRRRRMKIDRDSIAATVGRPCRPAAGQRRHDRRVRRRAPRPPRGAAARARARRRPRPRAALVTFDRHPAEVVRPGSAPKLLTTLDHRLELLDATGCSTVPRAHFDEARSHETGRGVRARGARRARSRASRRRRRRLPLRPPPGATSRCSSRWAPSSASRCSGSGSSRRSPARCRSRRRASASCSPAGDVEGAAALLGRPHEVRGAVERGDRRGASSGSRPRTSQSRRGCAFRPTASTPDVFRRDGSSGPRRSRSAAARPSTRTPRCRCSRPTARLRRRPLRRSGDGPVRRAATGPGALRPVEALIEQMQHDVEATRRGLSRAAHAVPSSSRAPALRSRTRRPSTQVRKNF